MVLMLTIFTEKLESFVTVTDGGLAEQLALTVRSGNLVASLLASVGAVRESASARDARIEVRTFIVRSFPSIDMLV